MLESASQPKTGAAKASFPALWILPNFGVVVFAVALLQVLFLSQGAQGLFRDSDTGWHVLNGATMLATGEIPSADHWSYTKIGDEWFAWEWLADAALGLVHQSYGLAGVAFVSAITIALTAWASARLALSLGGNLFFTAGATVLLLGATSIHWLARPHVFSWLIGVLFLSIAEYDRRGPGRTLCLLPVLALLWANLHGSFLLGPLLLFLYGIGECFEGHRRRSARIRFFAASLASLLATFVNPYGWRLHEHVFAYLNNAYLMDHIAEFRSFSFHSAGALYVELFMLVAVLGLVALLRQRAFGPALLALGLLHISLYSARHLPTAAVMLLPLSVAALTAEARAWPGLRSFMDYGERLRAIDRRVPGVAPFVLVLLGATIGLGSLAAKGGVSFDSAKFPVRAATFLERELGAERVFAKDQWGGYLIYRFGGRTKVFLDGRSDFYGQNILETYAQVVEVKPGWDAILRHYDIRFVLVPADNALASALQLNPEWKRVHTDSVAAVFKRLG